MSTSFQQIRQRSTAAENFLLSKNTPSDRARYSCESTQVYQGNLIRRHDRSSEQVYHLQKSKQRRPLHPFTVANKDPARLSTVLEDDVLTPGDFTVYQEANFQDFFGPETKPDRVSQVCLVNDHFMLVKMPESRWRRNSQDERITVAGDGGDELHITERMEAASESSEKQPHSKATNYFCCNRSRKISPIPEVGWDLQLESDGKVGDVETSNTRGTTEVYDTITKISHRPNNFSSCNKTVEEGKKTKALKVKSGQQVKRVRIMESTELTRNTGSVPQSSDTKHTTENETTEEFYNSAMRESVVLHQHGGLVTPDQRVKFLNDPVEEFYDQNDYSRSNQFSTKTQRQHFNAIHWLLRPFRGRGPTKPKSKIHAVIYKTYFVRWKKSSSSSSPRGYLNGFGVKPEVVERLPKLRRCKSANF